MSGPLSSAQKGPPCVFPLSPKQRPVETVEAQNHALVDSLSWFLHWSETREIRKSLYPNCLDSIETLVTCDSSACVPHRFLLPSALFPDSGKHSKAKNSQLQVSQGSQRNPNLQRQNALSFQTFVCHNIRSKIYTLTVAAAKEVLPPMNHVENKIWQKKTENGEYALWHFYVWLQNDSSCFCFTFQSIIPLSSS